MKKIILVMMMAGVAFSMTNNASAALVAIGDPQLTGSWTQTFFMSGSGNFDRVDVFVDWGTTLKGDGLEHFSNNDWGGSCSSDGLFGSYKGGETSDLGFGLHVYTDTPQPFNITFQFFNKDTSREFWGAGWDGYGWHIGPGCPPPGTSVPEPSTMLLLGSGLLGLAGYVRRRMRR